LKLSGYLLEGFDRSWVAAGSRREAIYTNLKAGNYRFRVAASTLAGASTKEATWSFVVEPAFYETIWFLAICGGVMVVSIAVAVQLSARRKISIAF